MDPLEILESRIKDNKSQIADYMMSGRIGSFMEYTRLAARAEALRTVEAEIADIRNRFIDD